MHQVACLYYVLFQIFLSPGASSEILYPVSYLNDQPLVFGKYFCHLRPIVS